MFSGQCATPALVDALNGKTFSVPVFSPVRQTILAYMMRKLIMMLMKIKLIMMLTKIKSATTGALSMAKELACIISMSPHYASARKTSLVPFNERLRETMGWG